ncbi:MAG: AAA family ATPase [Anaerolineae bacterium]
MSDVNSAKFKPDLYARHPSEPLMPIQAGLSPERFSKALLSALQEPRSLEATGLPVDFMQGLTLKIVYHNGQLRGWEVARALRLNFSGVVEPLLQDLKNQHFVEVTGGEHHNRASFRYKITEKGAQYARELLDRNRYAGPCPVNLQHYIDIVRLQAQHRPSVTRTDVEFAMQGLVMSREMLDKIGPAVNSFKSMFVYGPPGNGKTTIARAIAHRLLSDHVMVPHAIYEGGHVIKVFDLEVHPVIGSESAQLANTDGLDKRWVVCGTPIMITGGELTLHDLDLAWSETNRYYEAPVQLKANGGILLIDDFGRQRVPPRDLLNRWIVPLEERLDFLTLQTGKKFAVPFETLVVFSTNLNPESLVDEAFLRRIRHKLHVDNPEEAEFRQIFKSACADRGILFEDSAYSYLLEEYYNRPGRSLKACHPRDLLDQVLDFSSYHRVSPKMTTDMIDRAARSYFGELM